MLSFLDLPRELRDKILGLVIATPMSPPPSPADAGDRTEVDVPGMRSSAGGKSVKYPRRFNRVDSIPTLLVNHQLHNDTLNAIDRLPTKHSYEVDVMLVDEGELWPTWLSVPAISSHADKIAATFRIFGVNRRRRGGFQLGNGGPPAITWAFYNALQRLLLFGPIGFKMNVKYMDFSIKRLELNVLTPEGPVLPKDSKRHESRPVEDATANHVMHPEYLAEYITRDIRRLLGMSYHFASYGGILYERIGEIVIMVDGEMYREWDLAKHLFELKFNDSFGEQPREKRLATFQKWKMDAYKSRVRFGLPVIEGEEESCYVSAT